jgi:hypothetical protein
VQSRRKRRDCFVWHAEKGWTSPSVHGLANKFAGSEVRRADDSMSIASNMLQYHQQGTQNYSVQFHGTQSQNNYCQSQLLLQAPMQPTLQQAMPMQARGIVHQSSQMPGLGYGIQQQQQPRYHSQMSHAPAMQPQQMLNQMSIQPVHPNYHQLCSQNYVQFHGNQSQNNYCQSQQLLQAPMQPTLQQAMPMQALGNMYPQHAGIAIRPNVPCARLDVAKPTQLATTAAPFQPAKTADEARQRKDKVGAPVLHVQLPVPALLAPKSKHVLSESNTSAVAGGLSFRSDQQVSSPPPPSDVTAVRSGEEMYPSPWRPSADESASVARQYSSDGNSAMINEAGELIESPATKCAKRALHRCAVVHCKPSDRVRTQVPDQGIHNQI